MNIGRLTIVVPCYNEETSVGGLLDRLAAVSAPGFVMEVIVVDDGSHDRTWEELQAASARHGFVALRHEVNLGKGAAVRTALDSATGEAVIVQDADTEYDPADIPSLLAAYRGLGSPAAIYGSRNLRTNRYSYAFYYVGGRLLTAAANLLYGQKLTDAFTGYKLVPTGLLRKMRLESRRFEFCAEVTSKLARLGVPIVEVPISYNARSFAEGKKIRVSDGLMMAHTFLRWRLWRPERRWNAFDRLLARWRLRRVLAELRPGDAVLDVGCGRERMLWRSAAPMGLRYTGIDPDLTAEEHDGAARFVPARIGTGALPFADESFDAVTALALVEHLERPELLFEEAWRVLRPGGHLLMTTPTPAAEPVLKLMAALRLIDPVEIAEHKRYFRGPELKKLAKDAGFGESRYGIFQFGFNSFFSARK